MSQARPKPYRSRTYGRLQLQELLEFGPRLDAAQELMRRVENELRAIDVDRSMQPRQVVGAFLLSEMNGVGFEELEWLLADRQSYRVFCNTDEMYPKYFSSSHLQTHIECLTSDTIRCIYDTLAPTTSK